MIEDTDLVPGTVHLVDVDGSLEVKKQKNDIILRPPPTSNPNDPLRWSKKKKQSQFFVLFWLATFLAITVNWSGPVWVIWTEEFGCTFDQLNIASALCFLFLGVGCVFLQPTALKLGRRFVYLSCCLLMIAANILGARLTKVQHLFGVNIIGGFAAAPCDSLVEISTTDVFFQHERASYLSLFILALYVGSDIGPAISGYIVDTIGWRWSFYLQAIMFGLMFVVALFYMEDTTFRRDEEDLVLETDIINQIKSRDSKVDEVQQVKEIAQSGEDSADDSDADSVDHSIPLRTYKQKMRLYETEYNDRRSWLCIFYRPFFMIGFPAIIWGSLYMGPK